MPTDESHHASSLSPESDREDSSSQSQLSTKLTDKLEKLARWRLSPSLIKFPTSGPEFHGGYATVSRAFLTSSPNTGSEMREFSNEEQEAVHLEGRNLESEDAVEEQKQETFERQKVVAVKKMKIKGDLGRVLGLTLREAEFLVELEHENIIAFEGFVEDVPNDIIWLVFPWEDNGTLKAFIASRDWEIPERISLIDDVARGVKYLHSLEPPICHGDLKSLNVMVNSECRAIINDFGSARRVVAEGSNTEGERTPNKLQDSLPLEATFCVSTNTITLTGNQYTLRWAAPELLLDDQSSLRSDIWALGWVAYEVMTNSIPFQDIKDIVVIKHVIQGDLPSITTDARMLVVQALCSLMTKCWSIDPTSRPTAEDCRKSISWMPMIIPNSPRTMDAAASGARSPGLLLELGIMYHKQGDCFNASKFVSEALGIYTDIGDQKGRAQALWRLALIRGSQNELDQAISLFTEALQVYTDIGSKEGRGEALVGLAAIHHVRNEYSQSLPLLYEALQICTEIDFSYGRANALSRLAAVHHGRSEYNQAVTFYSEAIEILTDFGDKRVRAYARSGLAGVHRVRSEWSQAVMLFSQALEDHTDVGDRNGRAYSLWGLADVHRARNEYNQAGKLFSEVLDIVTDIGDREARAMTLGGLADLHRVRNEYDEAATFYSEALEILNNVGNREERAIILWGLADVHRLRSEYDKAVALYSKALEINTDIGDKRGRAVTLRGLADVYRVRNEYDQAVTLYHEAVEIQTDIGDRRGKACALGGLAEVHRLRKEYSQANAIYSEVLEIATDIGDRSRKAYVLSGQADVYRDQHDHGNALQHYEQAAEIFNQLGHAKDLAYALEQAADVRRRLEQEVA